MEQTGVRPTKKIRLEFLTLIDNKETPRDTVQSSALQTLTVKEKTNEISLEKFSHNKTPILKDRLTVWNKFRCLAVFFLL